MKKKISVLLLALAVLLAGCGKTTDTMENREKLRVVTSFYPMFLLAQAVTEGAEGVELLNMAQPQTGCLHDYELTISDMKLLEGADVLLINGGGMESFLTQALERYPELIIVDTSAEIELLTVEEHHHHHEGEEAHHGHDHDHTHEGNPHIWLSPEGAAQQAEAMALALAELDAADAALFTENAEAFHEGAHGLEHKAHQIGIPEGEFAAVFHEGFDYITDLFHMEKVFGIIADEYQMPSAKELAEAADEAKGHGIRFFLTAADHGEIYAETLAAEVDEAVVVLDPLTTADEAGCSYLERMEKNIEAIERHWKEAAE
ncbi:MAG: zinc ABC transporter substrate-binding protein [Bacillota bacterium]|nr:zinc ABC transporter substrate-binding protein [Bacillota bacterium]